MQLTKFGRTGISISRLCLGTATFGKHTDQAESQAFPVPRLHVGQSAGAHGQIQKSMAP
jgi:aryl-alcohol dehydrogenase-like predicted oxidoreductase